MGIITDTLMFPSHVWNWDLHDSSPFFFWGPSSRAGDKDWGLKTRPWQEGGGTPSSLLHVSSTGLAGLVGILRGAGGRWARQRDRDGWDRSTLRTACRRRGELVLCCFECKLRRESIGDARRGYRPRLREQSSSPFPFFAHFVLN